MAEKNIESIEITDEQSEQYHVHLQNFFDGEIAHNSRMIDFYQKQINKHREELELTEDEKEREFILSQIKTKELIIENGQKKISEIESLIPRLKTPEKKNHLYDKYFVFQNIRYLLSATGIKIGQIEKEAEVKAGYMSRLENEKSTAEPSVDFVVAAAKLLKVSVDALLTVDFTTMSENELYLYHFIEKLISDTEKDKLLWNKESKTRLNRLSKCNRDEHPLYDVENHEYYNEYRNEKDVTNDLIFVSDTYGLETVIDGDCYNLRLKNGDYLYLMDVSDIDSQLFQTKYDTLELWMVCNGEKRFLISGNESTGFSTMMSKLYSTIEKYMKHPKVVSGFKSAIDAFMNDDMEDDEIEEMPFH